MALQHITAGMTGEQAASIIYGNDNEVLVKTQEVEAKLPETIPTKNLFNTETVQNNKYVGSIPPGAIATATGWTCSAFIPVTPGLAYTLSGTKSRVGFGFYDSAFNPVRYSGINLGTVTPLTGEVYVCFNLQSVAQPGYSNIQFEQSAFATAYEPFGYLVKKEVVEGLEDAIQNAQDALEATAALAAFDIEEVVSVNLFNPHTVILQTLVSQITGALISAQTLYNTTDLTPVLPSQLYTGLNISGAEVFRTVAFYNAVGTFISGVDGFVTSFTTPSTAAFVRVSVFASYAVTGYGIFLGASPTWQPYTGGYVVKLVDDNVPTLSKDLDAVATIKDVQTLAGPTANDPKVDYNLAAGGALTITYPFGNIVGKVAENRGFDGNNMFNFASFSLAGVAASNVDDAAPVHAFATTIGANHGPTVYNATIASHGLTNTAIGTAWLNSGGINFYVLRIINSSTVVFLSQNNGTANSPAFVALTTGTLTRSGTTLTVSSVVAAQMYPSIINLQRRVLINGSTEITSGAGTAQYIDVVESYDIMTQDSVLQAAIARAGTSGAPVYTGDPALRIENIYRFVPGGTCIVINTFKAIRPVTFADIMVTQAGRIGTNGATQYYVPNSSPLNGSVDLRTPTAITWSGAIPSTFVVNASQPEPTNPPNRVISYFNNLGFALGYLPTRGVGKALDTFTARSFEIRNDTGKIYPHALESTRIGSPIPVNTVVSTVMYRSYTNLAETRVGNRLSYFSFEFEGATYAYVDYSASMQDFVNLQRPALNGKEIEVLEAKNAVLQNDTYNDGMHVKATYVAGQTCYVVARIS